MCAHTLHRTARLLHTHMHEHTYTTVDVLAHLEEQIHTKCATILSPQRCRDSKEQFCPTFMPFSTNQGIKEEQKAEGSQLEAKRQTRSLYLNHARYYRGYFFFPEWKCSTVTETVKPLRHIRNYPDSGVRARQF